MSVGNLKDNGNKGNNFPYQLAVLKLLDQISSSVSVLPGTDYETRTSMYQATANGAGYSIGDIIIRYDIIDVSTSLVVSTVWFNQSTQSTIAAPLPGDIVPVVAPSSVTVINGVLGAAVNIQDGGNSITIDALSLPLPTGAATEATLLSLDAKFTSVTRTPSLIIATGAGSVAAGARSISVFNAGAAAGSILGVAGNIAVGESMSFVAGGENDVLSIFAYDGTGTTLKITTIV